MRRILPATLICLALTAGWIRPAPFPEQDPQAGPPLPELDGFLQEVRLRLRSDQLLLSQYTYTEKQTMRRLDGKGKVSSVEERVYEVYPSLEEDLNYRRLVSENGKPRNPKDLAKSDRDHDRKAQEWARKLEREGTDERARRLAKEAEEKRKEDRAIDEMLALYRIRMTGREVLDGHDAILLEFEPRTGFKPRTREGKVLAKIAGKAWVCEADYEVIRVEVRLIDTISFGLGLLARLNKGATAEFQRRKLNDEIWLPAEARFTGTGRLLLLKGVRINATSEFSDYLKFSVETRIQYRK